MALLTVGGVGGNTATTPPAPATISAWAAGDTISAGDIGERGVMAIVVNTSGGSLDFRVEDTGTTRASNPAANGYTTYTIPTANTRWIYIGPGNVNNTTQSVKVGSSGAAVGTFNVQLARY